MKPITDSDDRRLVRLLERRGDPAPRYVAYPSPNLWRDKPPPGERIRRLRAVAESGEGLALYVHVPFCPRLCHYCGCNVEVRSPVPKYGDLYLSGIRKELEGLRACSGGIPRAVSLHLGGGTPTFLSETQLTELMAILSESIEFVPNAELSVETNPETVTPSQLRTLWELGFSRISLGIQDFNRDTQWAINRYHPYDRVRCVVDDCRHAGFASVNFDLVYGLPHQTASRFATTVERTISLAPNRVALYHFGYLPDKLPHQRLLDERALPSPLEKHKLFQGATLAFASEGYPPIGMDHFAEPGDTLVRAFRERRLVRSFMGYESRSVRNVLGFGPGAISFLDGAYLRNVPSNTSWTGALNAGASGQDLMRVQTEEDQVRHALINHLLCHLEIKDESLAEAFGSQALGIVSELEAFVRDGILERRNGRRRLTTLGRPFARAVARTFDQYRLVPSDATRSPCSRVT